MNQVNILESTLRQVEQQFSADSQIGAFEKSIDDFNKMVSEGIAKPRGYNILSVENSFLTMQFE